MRRGIQTGALVLALALAVAGCQKTTGSSVSEYQKQRDAVIAKRKQEAARADESEKGQGQKQGESDETRYGDLGGAYMYDPVGKRDPFRSFVLDRVAEANDGAKGPLEQFDLSQLDVSGVVWEADNKRALVTDPSGRAYVVKVGDPIGKNDGEVMSIQDSAVQVREAYVDFHGKKTTKEIMMRVRQSQGG